MWWQMRCIHFHMRFDSDEQQQTGTLNQHCFPLDQMRKHYGRLCLQCCTSETTALGKQMHDHTCYILCVHTFYFLSNLFSCYLILCKIYILYFFLQWCFFLSFIVFMNVHCSLKHNFSSSRLAFLMKNRCIGLLNVFYSILYKWVPFFV